MMSWLHGTVGRFRCGLAASGLPVTQNEEKLLSLKNRHEGKRCFIIGNGPSLKTMDLAPLRNEVTIGCNGLFLMLDHMGFTPTFYTCEDTLVAEDRRNELNALKGTTKVWPMDVRYCLKPDGDTVYCNFLRRYGSVPRFTDDFVRRVFWGGTVTFFSLQLAYFIGAREIYLVGIDHNYQAHTAKDELKGYEITSRSQDVNHFHPDYFGPGYRWHVPQVERMERSYVVAKSFADANSCRILNATAGGKLEVFPRVDYRSLFSPSTETIKT